MAWDFSTDLEFQEKLDWVEQFCREQIEPLTLAFPAAGWPVGRPPAVERLVDGLKDNNSEAELAAIKAQQEQMVAAMKGFGEVKEKDVVTLDYVEGTTRILLNGQAKATIPGDAFNAALTKVWLGDKPVQADLKKALLGG